MTRAVLALAAFGHLRRSVLARASRHRTVPLGPPLSVALGVTARCTYRCLHCEAWRQTGEELDLGAWTEVFDQLVRWMGPTHVMFAGGEPMLRPDLGDLVRAAARRRLLPSLVTNGAPAIPPDEVAAWPLVSLTLSIDSMTPGPHDTLHRAPGAHQRVTTLLEELCRRGMGPRLRVASVLTGLNTDEIVPLARWVADRGIGGFSLQPLGEPFAAPHRQDWYSTSGLGVDPGEVERIVKMLRQGRAEGWPILNPARQLQLLAAYYADPERSLMPCSVGTTSLGIGPAGDLRFCPYLPPFGHVGIGFIRDQWFGAGAARLRAAIHRCSRGCSIMNCTFNPTMGERLRRWWRFLPSVGKRQ